MDDCIMWTGHKRTNGYGVKVVNYKRVAAHRWLWQTIHGEIPDGFVIDHICHNEAAKRGECEGGFTCPHRSCVNPNHLRAISQSENVSSGMHSIDVKSTCPQGHSYRDERNIMIRKNGKRECAECNRERSRKNWASRNVKAGA